MNDYENDSKRSLRLTDPSGNTSEINSNTNTPCPACGLYCSHPSQKDCKGPTMLSDMGLHLCEKHQQELGAVNRWYESRPSNHNSPVQRMLGKELSNFGGQYKDEQDTGQDYTKEDPHYHRHNKEKIQYENN